MVDYLTGCACNGEAPKRLKEHSLLARNSLLTRMAVRRSDPRCLVAPSYFGKSSLAADYCRLFHGYENVWWIDASSLCFLRELDSGSLVDNLVARGAAVVVFDDAVALEAGRLRVFRALVGDLCAAGVEVIVCATPENRPFEVGDENVAFIEVDDFLLDDVEMAAYRQLVGALGKEPAARDGVYGDDAGSNACVLERIVGVACGDAKSEECFLTSQIDGCASDSLRALLFALSVLGHGGFDDLERIVGSRVLGLAEGFAKNRPYIEWDSSERVFRAEGFSAHAIVRCFGPYVLQISRILSQSDNPTFVLRAADALLFGGNAQRAAFLVMNLCDVAERALWLVANQMRMHDLGAIEAASNLCASLASHKTAASVKVLWGEALRCCLAGNKRQGLDALARIVRRADAPRSDRLRAATDALLFDDRESCVGQLLSELEKGFDDDVSEGRSWRSARFSKQRPDVCEMLSRMWLYDGVSADRFWESSRMPLARIAPAEERAYAMAAFLRLSRKRILHIEDAGRIKALDCSLERAASMIFAHCTCCGTTSVAEMLLVQQVERSPQMLVALHASITPEARRRCNALTAALRPSKGNSARDFPVLFDDSASDSSMQACDADLMGVEGPLDALAHPEHPRLHLRMFGTFEATVNGKQIPSSAMSRRKVRTLLAILALKCGKEMSINRLCKILWPESDPDAARRNLYCVCSILRAALALPDESCPFLKHAQGIYALDASLTYSDVEELSEVCRKMRFATADQESYAELLRRAKSLYAGELLPGEDEGSVVGAARTEWRNKLVDSLLAASSTLLEEGDRETALSYARFALSCDPRREDAYEIAIELNRLCGCRPAAVELWLRYTKLMNVELGLDPSSRVAAAYQRVIDDEEAGDLPVH